MNNLPIEVINQIMRFNYHPVADAFKNATKNKLEELYETIPGDYDYGGSDFCHADEYSFAYFFFHGCEGESHNRHIYQYAWMDILYLETLNEYLRSN